MAGRGSAPGERRGGRVKGTPNKAKTELAELIRAACGDFDPVVGMAIIAAGKFKEEDTIALDTDGNPIVMVPTLDQRITCMKEVAKYMHAQRKAVEHSVADDSQPMVVGLRTDPKGRVSIDDLPAADAP